MLHLLRPKGHFGYFIPTANLSTRSLVINIDMDRKKDFFTEDKKERLFCRNLCTHACI